jgi:Ion channel
LTLHRAHRFTYLLAAEVALIVLSPLVAGDPPRPGIPSAFAIVVFLSALWAVGGDRPTTMIATVLAAPAIGLSVVAAAGMQTPVLGPAIVFGILFLAFVTAVIARDVVTTRDVTTETLNGAIATYLLLGLIWGWAYGLVEQLHPGSFRSSVSPDGRVAGPEFTFLSFVTLTSVGYGDLIPVSGYARVLAILEAVAGLA